MSINTKVEQIAYGHVTAQVLRELGQQENWYKAYEYLSECVERGDEPDDLVIWQPFEHWEWKDILEQIESEAESLLSTIKSVLGLAHKGIIQSAIDCSLDSDMTQLDLIGMVEIGSEIEEMEIITPPGMSREMLEQAVREGYSERDVVKHRILECPVGWFMEADGKATIMR